MPLLKLQTSVPVPDDKKDSLLAAVSGILAEVTGKPETYVMVTLEGGTACMGGVAGPAAFADVRGIGGLDGNVNAEISKRICHLLKDELGIEGDRVYLNFTDVPAQNWGWNGGTF